MVRPHIFRYDNYRKYLGDWYTWMKEVREGFSFRAFSAWVGFKSPNQLQLVIKGKRNISLASADRYCKVLKLKKGEQKYFDLLIRFNQAKTMETRASYFKEISAFHLKRGSILKSRQYNYLSVWYYSALREMVAMKGFQENGSWISKKLNGLVTPHQAKEAIEALLEMGLLARGPHRRLMQTTDYVTTGDETEAVAASLYHDQMIRMAQHSLMKGDPAARNLTAVTFTIRAQDYATVIDDINDFRKRLTASLQNREDLRNDEGLYQLNIHLFPLSRN